MKESRGGGGGGEGKEAFFFLSTLGSCLLDSGKFSLLHFSMLHLSIGMPIHFPTKPGPEDISGPPSDQV